MSTESQTEQELDLKRVENRLRTFENWPIRFISISDLANAGFYYLNNSDQVRCVECGGVIGQWEQGDVPHLEHRKFFPNCPIVRQNDLTNEEIGIQQVRTPKYPEYSTIESRSRSFSNWTSAAQDASRLAQAGFYYLGSCDEVRCFYCDGGLRNWLENDDPWFEHARWFPKCSFVQLVKGSAYIKNVLQRTQNTNQITASAPTAPISIDDAMTSQPAYDALQMGLNAGRVRVVMQRRLQMTGRPFTSTEALVAAVLDGQIEDEGFEQDLETEEGQIESQVTELLLSAVHSVAFTATDVVERASTSTETNSSAAAAAPVATISSVRPIVPENSNTSALTRMQTAELRRASEATTSEKLPSGSEKSTTDAAAATAAVDDSDDRRLKNVECKICMTEEVGVVFLPCGHLLSCVYCAPALAQCPLCRETIRGRVRTFLS